MGNSPTDWILGYKHRRLSKAFYNLFDACDGPPVGNDVLVELGSFVLKLTTVGSFSEFQEANRHPESGINILYAAALSAICHWREVNAADFVEGDYHKPRWSNGTHRGSGAGQTQIREFKNAETSEVVFWSPKTIAFDESVGTLLRSQW